MTRSAVSVGKKEETWSCIEAHMKKTTMQAGTEKKVFNKDLWQSVDEYFAFAVKHQVYGMDAVKLWKKLKKQVIPIPKVKR